MSIPVVPPEPRMAFPDAMREVLKVLKDLGEDASLSIAAIARKTGIDRRTVDKVVATILEIQDTLRAQTVLKHKVGRSYVVKLIERSERVRDAISSAGRRLKKRE
ncbi:MAG: hypothetical protein HXY34_06725 [Candidatus Thorarchaeota archaeon]|nr:hypothetical protein [Candidatus Thorarchaeota archaeon]